MFFIVTEILKSPIYKLTDTLQMIHTCNLSLPYIINNNLQRRKLSLTQTTADWPAECLRQLSTAIHGEEEWSGPIAAQAGEEGSSALQSLPAPGPFPNHANGFCHKVDEVVCQLPGAQEVHEGLVKVLCNTSKTRSKKYWQTAYKGTVATKNA